MEGFRGRLHPPVRFQPKENETRRALNGFNYRIIIQLETAANIECELFRRNSFKKAQQKSNEVDYEQQQQ